MEVFPFIGVITVVFAVAGWIAISYDFFNSDWWSDVWVYSPTDDFSFVTTISYNPDHDIDGYLPDTESDKFHIRGIVKGRPKKDIIMESQVGFAKNITKDETYRISGKLVEGSWDCDGCYVAEHQDLALYNIRSGVKIGDALSMKLLLALHKQWRDKYCPTKK